MNIDLRGGENNALPTSFQFAECGYAELSPQGTGVYITDDLSRTGSSAIYLLTTREGLALIASVEEAIKLGWLK